MAELQRVIRESQRGKGCTSLVPRLFAWEGTYFLPPQEPGHEASAAMSYTVAGTTMVACYLAECSCQLMSPTALEIRAERHLLAV